MLVSLFILKFDWDAAIILEKQFVVLPELSLVLVLFIFPGSLVAVGSYLHALKRRAWGQLLIGFGCEMVIGIFLFCLIIILPGGINTWSILNLSLVLLSSLTLVFSVIAQKELDN